MGAYNIRKKAITHHFMNFLQRGGMIPQFQPIRGASIQSEELVADTSDCRVELPNHKTNIEFSLLALCPHPTSIYNI